MQNTIKRYYFYYYYTQDKWC